MKKVIGRRTPLIYARVSTEKQRKGGALDSQVDTVIEALQEAGVKKTPLVFKDVQSGTHPSTYESSKSKGKKRRGLAALKEKALSNPSKYAIVVRDTQRYARDPWLAGYEFYELRDAGIPLVSVIENQHSPSPEGDLLMPILTSIGFQEVGLRSEQTIKGMEETDAWKGALLDLYSDEPLNPYRELLRVMPFWPPKGVRAGKGEMGASDVAFKLRKTSGWAYRSRDRINMIRDKGGEELLNEWLDATDRIRKMEAEHGAGIKTKGRMRAPTKKMAAVRRATGGYLAEPWNDKYAKATAELEQFAFDNPEQFKTAKQRRKR